MLLTSLVLKFFFFKFGAIAVVSFSMQVVWMYLSQRRGGDRDTNTTFHLPFASKIKFSSRVNLLNKIGKKTLRTENRIAYLVFSLKRHELSVL